MDVWDGDHGHDIQDEQSQYLALRLYLHLVDAIANLLTKSIVNRNFTKLILQNANLPLILLLQDVVDKCCLACDKEMGEQIYLARNSFKIFRGNPCQKFTSVVLPAPRKPVMTVMGVSSFSLLSAMVTSFVAICCCAVDEQVGKDLNGLRSNLWGRTGHLEWVSFSHHLSFYWLYQSKGRTLYFFYFCCELDLRSMLSSFFFQAIERKMVYYGSDRALM